MTLRLASRVESIDVVAPMPLLDIQRAVVSTVVSERQIAELPIDAPALPAAGLPEPLPIVLASDVRIARARGLFAAGRAGEALRLLDAVNIADPRRPDVDRLRADIQRVMLHLEPLDAAALDFTALALESPGVPRR